MLYYQNPFLSKSRRIILVHVKYNLKVMNSLYHILIGASLFFGVHTMIYSCVLNSVLQYSLFKYPSSNDSDIFGSFLLKKKTLLWQNICKYKTYCFNHFNYTIQWY